MLPRISAALVSFISPIASHKAGTERERPDGQGDGDAKKFKKDSPPKLRIIKATDGEPIPLIPPIPEGEPDSKRESSEQPEKESLAEAPATPAGSSAETGTQLPAVRELNPSAGPGPGPGVAQSLLQLLQLLGGERGIFRKWAGLKTYHDVGSGKKGAKFRKGAMLDDRAG